MMKFFDRVQVERKIGREKFIEILKNLLIGYNIDNEKFDDVEYTLVQIF